MRNKNVPCFANCRFSTWDVSWPTKYIRPDIPPFIFENKRPFDS